MRSRRHQYVRTVRDARARSRPRRRWRAVAFVLGGGALLGSLTSFWPQAEAASDGIFRDQFSSVSYGNSNGSLSWTSTPWQEIGESNGASTDPVSVGVWSSRCASGNCLRINDTTAGTSFGVQRSANLSGAAEAILTFSYTLEEDDLDDDNSGVSDFTLEVSSSASGPWTLLATYTVSGSISAPIPEAFDITPFISANTTVRVMSDGTGLSDEIYLDDFQIESVPASDLDPHLWFSIRDDTTSGPPALPSLKDGAIASFADPGVNYEPGVTAGTLSTLVDWESQFGISTDIDSLHLVTTTMTVGGVALTTGDLLFVLTNDITLTGTSGGSIAYKKNDVARFHPATPGDFTSGSFSILLDNPVGADLNGVTLVEQTTLVGEVTLSPGTFLITRMGGSEHADVYRFVVASAGEGSTSGTVTKLLEGDEMGFGDQVWDLDLVEDGMGWPFPRGAIVLTVERDVLIGLDGTAAAKRTLMSVIVARTSLSGTARVNAILAWDGNDLGFNEDKERVDAFTFADYDLDPVFDQNITNRNDPEGTVISFSATATDPLGDGLIYSATGLPPGVGYGSSSGLVSGSVDYAAAVGSPYSVTLTATDPGGNTVVDNFTWNVSEVNRAPELKDHLDQVSAEGDVTSLALIGADPDGDPVVWSAAGLPAGLAISPTTGLVSGTISYDASPASPYTVTVRLTDDGSPALWVEDTYTWKVANTNRAPIVVDPGAQGDAEGDAVILAVIGSDPDGDALSWVAFDLPPGLAINPSTGVITGTLSYGASTSSPYPVLVRAFDDGIPVARGEVSLSWTVSNTNRAPLVTNPGDRSNAEGDPVTYAIAGSDPDGDQLTWTAAGLPPGLSIGSGNGVISGTISFDAAGNHAVTVRATDDGSPALFTEVGFAWVVGDTNRKPIVTNPDPQSDAEGSAVSVAVTGVDPDLDPMTWTAVGLPSGLTMSPSTGVISGSLSFTASTGSPYSVIVRATDDGAPALFDETTFAWAVTDTNRNPQVADPGDRSNAEGDVVTFAISGSDPDADGLIWTATGLPPGLSITPGSGVIGGTISFDAAPGSPFTVTVRATDDGSPALYDEVVFSWNVVETNRPPLVTNPGSQIDAESDSVSLALAGSDPDADGLVWSAAGLPAGLSINPATGEITGTISFSASSGSPYSVTVRATDDGAPSQFSEVAFAWSVVNTNRTPAVTDPGTQGNAEADPVTLALAGSDPDADGLTWTATGLPPGLSISSTTGVISGTISYEAAGVHAVMVSATDDGSPQLTGQTSFSWTVANTNRMPVVSNPGAQSSAEGEAINLAGTGFDPDGNGLTWTATGLPPGITISPTTGNLTGTLGFSTSGTRTVTVRATDDGAPSLFTDVSFTWMVSNTNRAPTVFNPGDQTNAEGDAVSLAIVAGDPDGNSIAFEAGGLPPGLVIDPSSGVISGNLGFNLLGNYSVVVTVTDDGSPVLVSQVALDWFIAEVNRPPVVAPIADRSSEQGVAISIVPSVTEPDGDVITWTATGLPAGMSINPVSGVVTGSPGTPGSYGVVFTATDNGQPAATDDETFTWTVVSPPGFPVIDSIAARQDLEEEPVSFTASAVHPDGLDITWTATELPIGIVIDSATGLVHGEPAVPGTWFTRITVTDERDQAATASFVWIVESAEDLPPLPGNDTITVAIDEITVGGIALDAVGNDVDPEGLAVRLVTVFAPEVGEAALVDGIVVFRPPSGWLGTVIIRYLVADPAGNEAEGTITVTVLDSLDNRLVAGALTGGATPGVVDLGALGALTPAAGTEMLLSSVFQSLYVLRVPLALLGGAVFWSLLLGGILNLGFVLRGGVPRLVRRTSRQVAVVLVPHGGRVDVLSEPSHGELLARLTATQRGIEATGRRIVAPDGEEWAEIRTEAGVGWARSFHLTEEVDRSGFASDPEAMDLVKEFVDRLRARREFSDLVSQHGLFVAHHAPLVYFAPSRLSGVMDDPMRLVWKGRNPAYPDFSGSFDLAVATGVLDAFDHPLRELLHDRPATPSTVIPVEFTNLHFVSIGADVHGPERLEQSAWLVMISYEAAHPRIVGLVREG